MTWLNFGFALFIFAVAMVTILWFFAKWIGSAQLWKDYSASYDRLRIAVHNWDITYESYIVIADSFKEIRKFACRNDNKIYHLEQTFRKRFHVFSKPPKVEMT